MNLSGKMVLLWAFVGLLSLIATAADARGHRNSVSLAGLPSPLVDKVQEIQSACGSIVVSSFRPGARTPRGHLSEHAKHHAADVSGNPRCIYAHLHNWPGGYSVDYATAPGGHHVHISYGQGGREWGARFVHYHPRHQRVQVAHIDPPRAW